MNLMYKGDTIYRGKKFCLRMMGLGVMLGFGHVPSYKVTLLFPLKCCSLMNMEKAIGEMTNLALLLTMKHKDVGAISEGDSVLGQF